MAQLTFTEKAVGNGKVWEATTTANADFNLHIERTKGEYIQIEVSTVENGAYSTVYAKHEDEVVDHDFDAQVYPKYLRITSWSKPVDGKSFITETDE